MLGGYVLASVYKYMQTPR